MSDSVQLFKKDSLVRSVDARARWSSSKRVARVCRLPACLALAGTTIVIIITVDVDPIRSVSCTSLATCQKCPTTLSFTPPIEQNNSAKGAGRLWASGWLWRCHPDASASGSLYMEYLILTDIKFGKECSFLKKNFTYGLHKVSRSLLLKFVKPGQNRQPT